MKNFNKISIFIISISFLLSLYSIFLLTRCDLGSARECLWSKENLFADVYYQYNTLKYTGVHGVFPNIGIPNDVDGGYDGASFYGKDTRIIYHSPLYYYLAGFLYVLAKFLNVDDLIVLHIFSAVITLITNILFFFCMKKILKYFSKGNKKFIIYSVALFVFLPTPLHMSIGLQSDSMFYLSIIASFLAYLHFIENKTLKNATNFGLIVGLSSLTSMGGLTVLFALFIYLIKLYVKKEYFTRNLVFLSFAISFILGIIPWVRIYMLTGCLYGDMHSRSPHISTFLKLFFKFYKGSKAFWAGIEGGFSSLKIPLILVGILLIILTLIGLWIYLKDLRRRIDLDFIVLTYFFTVMLLLVFICNPFLFLKTGICYGREIQNRYMLSLAPLFPLFATIALIKLQNKKPNLKIFIWFYILATCLIFIVDFISALI